MFPEAVAEEVPDQQFGEGKCPLSHYVLFIYNLLPRITYLKPGLLWLALCYCFNIINEHDVTIYDTVILMMLMIL